ncbi:glycoside hydrolase family 43 protein [Ningiella sp. W23]|uniref:glycoside hydrolase family 43 protein n=1 Tax=Ningiella sp. W23 TaxID=3023715 RepID=UPI0037579897
MKLSTASGIFLAILCLNGCTKLPEDAPENPESYSGNPLFDGWYADPQIAIFNNQYWIFPTYSDEFRAQLHMDAFSSTDLSNWQKHENIIDNDIISWAKQAMWAPAIVEKDNQYYLFFAANDPQTPDRKWWNPDDDINHFGGIGVAVANSPGGPYRDYLGQPLISEFYNGAQPIDQFIFEDTDGTHYFFYGGWGHCNLGRLNEDFTGFEPWENGELFKEVTPEGYVEGSVMFIRNGKYYFMWSEGDWADNSYQVAYSISDSVEGPFERVGVVMSSQAPIATGAGHHSVLHIPDSDDYYFVYHRRPIPNESPHHRVVAIDEMHFDEDGFILPVVMTEQGVVTRKIK